MSDTTPSQDRATSSAVGHGSSDEDEHQTPTTAWASIILMVVGFALVGLAAVLISMTTMWALICGAVGVVIGLIGVGLGVRSRLMDNVE